MNNNLNLMSVVLKGLIEQSGIPKWFIVGAYDVENKLISAFPKKLESSIKSDLYSIGYISLLGQKEIIKFIGQNWAKILPQLENDWNVHNKKVNSERQEHDDKLNDILNGIPNEFAEWIRSEAYDRGHSCGYSEVECIADSLASDLLPVIKNYTQRIRSSTNPV